MSGYHGEVTRVEVCSNTFASDAPKLLDAFAKEAEGKGGMQFRISDAKFPSLAAYGSRADVTWQELKRWDGGPEDVRVLAKGPTERMPISRLQCAGDHRTYNSLPDAVAMGLCNFEDMGHAAGGGPRAYGSDATAYEGPHKEKISSFAFLDNLRFILGFPMFFTGITACLMYLATAFTFAPIHKENGELESLNYNAAGSPKFWVIIPKLFTRKLRTRLLRAGGEELLQRFLKKELVLPITVLNDWEVPYFTATQLPGWFVLTTGYHQVMNPGYSEACAVNFALQLSLFRYLYSSREIERPFAKKLLPCTEDEESASRLFQLPLLRLTVDFVHNEGGRADGEKLLCVHAVGFLRDRVGDVNAAVAKARRDGLPVEDWRGTGAEADNLSRQRYPSNGRVKAKVWTKRSGLQYPCSLCGTDTCLAAVELDSHHSPPTGVGGEGPLVAGRSCKSRKPRRAIGPFSIGGQAAASVHRASQRLAEQAARRASAKLPGASARSPTAEIDKDGGPDTGGGLSGMEEDGADEDGQDAGPFRNVVCPECFTDGSWEGSEKLERLIVFPDMAVAESYVGKPDSGQAPCRCREQGLGVDDKELENLETLWMGNSPEGNLFLSDCMDAKGADTAAVELGEWSSAKRPSGEEARAGEPAVKTLSLDGGGSFKWGGKQLCPESARAICQKGASDAERRARELGMVPNPLSDFPLFCSKVPGLDTVLQETRSRAAVRAKGAGRDAEEAANDLSWDVMGATNDIERNSRLAVDAAEGSVKSAPRDVGRETRSSKGDLVGEAAGDTPKPKRTSNGQECERPAASPSNEKASEGRRASLEDANMEVEDRAGREEPSAGTRPGNALQPHRRVRAPGQHTLQQSQRREPGRTRPLLPLPPPGVPTLVFPTPSMAPAMFWQPALFDAPPEFQTARPRYAPAPVPPFPGPSVGSPWQLPVHGWNQTVFETRGPPNTQAGWIPGQARTPQLVAQHGTSRPHTGEGRCQQRTVSLDVYLDGRETPHASKARLLEASGAPPAGHCVYKLLGINAPLLRRSGTLPDGDGVVGAFCFRIATDVAQRLGLKSRYTHQSPNFWVAWDHALRVVNEASPDEWESARQSGLQTNFLWRYLR